MGLFNRYSVFIVKVMAIIGYVLLSYWYYSSRMFMPVYIDVAFFLYIIDLRNVVSLKNYFLIYVFLIFKASSQFWFPDNVSIPFDGSIYASFFLLGYEIKKILTSEQDPSPADKDFVSETQVARLLFVLKIFLGLKVLYVVFLIFKYGFVDFYSGQMLADKINNWGKTSPIDAFFTIYGSFVDTFLVAIVVIYVKYIAALGKKPDYYYLAAALLLMPLLILSRSGFAFGLVTLLAIYGYFSKSTVKMYVYLVPVLIALFAVSVYIGTLRLNKYTSGEDFSDVNSSDHFFSELSPVLAYNTIKENINILKYQYGKTIILPLVTKVIPRSVWQTKPENSTAYYAKEFDYNSFYSGFMIPLTLFGDLFLNFGLYVTCFILFLLGCLISRLDMVYRNKEFRNIDLYFISFICFYSFVRNNLPESLIGILLMLFAKTFIEMLIVKRTVTSK